MVAILAVLVWFAAVTAGKTASPTSMSILSGPLAVLDIKGAESEAVKGAPEGTLTIGLHCALDHNF
jgi:hypothetical protein